jgi:Uncharacterized protein conserved in bacteria
MQPAIIHAVAAVLVIAGLVGTVLPVLPGVLLVFGGLFLSAWADDFTRVGYVAMTVIGVLALLAFVADFMASVLGAKRVGASPQALFGAGIGGFAGIFLGIPGVILGPFLGAALGEYMARGQLLRAGKVGFGTWFGMLLAAVAKVVIAVVMVATYFLAYALSRT